MSGWDGESASKGTARLDGRLGRVGLNLPYCPRPKQTGTLIHPPTSPLRTIHSLKNTTTGAIAAMNYGTEEVYITVSLKQT